MTDNTELKRLAEALIAATDVYMADECNDYLATNWAAADDAYQKATLPETVLALIAENEHLAKTADCWDRLNIQNKALSDSFRAERDQLQAENAGLKTGYEAYERVNAELKAENEALRTALKAAETAMWKAESSMDSEAADIRDLLAALGKGEQS